MVSSSNDIIQFSNYFLLMNAVTILKCSTLQANGGVHNTHTHNSIPNCQFENNRLELAQKSIDSQFSRRVYYLLCIKNNAYTFQTHILEPLSTGYIH